MAVPPSLQSAECRGCQRLLAAIYPGLKDSEYAAIFEWALTDQMEYEPNGNHVASLELAFKEQYRILSSGVLFGAAFPPAIRIPDIRFFDFGTHRLFYHSLHPLHVRDVTFLWNFYLGRRGEWVDSINEDAHKVHDIKVFEETTGKWSPCYPMTVPPRTRVRILVNKTEYEELVFPPSPHEIAVPVHHLPV
ncbi:hypothetical protein C8R46DRAFT_1124711 [Mycena filopes]|nr:hypothetical protein C8R46DRAFT_1124711 [Mycena filopes]